jgi:hypothetical protein
MRAAETAFPAGVVEHTADIVEQFAHLWARRRPIYRRDEMAASVSKCFA